MPAHVRARRLAPLVLSLLLAACAPDAWHAESAFDAYLDRVRINCWNYNIGSTTIPELMPDALTTNVYFMDVTSRFYYGKTSRADYLEALDATYMARADSPGVACILAQMPKTLDAPPPLPGK